MKARHQLATLAFFAKNQGWHSIDAHDQNTRRAVEQLVRAGYLQGNAYGQYRHTGKVFA